MAAARVHAVRVGRAAGGGGRGRAAGPPAARRRRRALPAPALRRAALLVLRRHGDLRLLLRPGRGPAPREPRSLHLHHAPAHLRPLAPRRGQVHLREVSSMIFALLPLFTDLIRNCYVLLNIDFFWVIYILLELTDVKMVIESLRYEDWSDCNL